MIDRVFVQNAFNEYVNSFDLNAEKIALKKDHSFHVAEVSEELGRALNLNDNDVELAWLIGQLHDIGRFTQLRDFDTYNDSISVDHARLGADILFKQGRIWDYLHEDDLNANDLRIVEIAIREHNAFEVREDLSEREQLFCNIIRDADKIDIFRVISEYPPEATWEVTVEQLRTSTISEKVIELVRNHSLVRKEYRITPLDQLVGAVSMIFGMNYDYSVILSKRQGNIEKIFNNVICPSDKNETIEYVTRIVYDYMNSLFLPGALGDM